MTTLKAKLLVPVAAVLAVGFGVVWVNGQQPGSQPAEPLRPRFAGGAPVAATDPRSTVAVPDGGSVLIGRTRSDGVNAATHRTPNFVVHAPTPVIARAVAAEAEYQRGLFAKTWFGKTLPVWEKPATITVKCDDGREGGVTGLTSADAKTGPRVASIEMTLYGSPLTVLGEVLPREVARAVLAAHFDKPRPRWAEDGIVRLHEPDDVQAKHDEQAREMLNAGRGIVLRTLFRMTEYPRDLGVLHAQGYSVCRFLLARASKLPTPGRHAALLEFVRIGMDGNTVESWGKAAKDVYGFESVDKLEEAWLEFLRQAPARATPPVELKDEKPDFIPPTKLPGATPPPRP